MQVTKTTLTFRSGWFWLPVFPILIFESWKPASNAKTVNKIIFLLYISKFERYVLLIDKTVKLNQLGLFIMMKNWI